MPCGHVAVCDTRCHVKHDDGALQIQGTRRGREGGKREGEGGRGGKREEREEGGREKEGEEEEKERERGGVREEREGGRGKRRQTDRERRKCE